MACDLFYVGNSCLEMYEYSQKQGFVELYLLGEDNDL